MPLRNNPDMSSSEVPYEKGYQFLLYIESLIGEGRMQELIRTYIKNNSLKSVNYTAFKKEFEKIASPSVRKQVNWNEWIHGIGKSPVV